MIVEGTFLLVGIALLQWGIAGFYAQYKDRYGRLGVVGTYLVGLGLLPFAVGGLSVILVAIVRGNPLSPTEPISMPLNEYVLITQAFMLGLFIASAGAFALGISLWRADIGVRGGAVLLASALPLLLFLPAEQLPIIKVNLDALLATGTFGLAWIILGDRLRTATPVRG